MIDSGVESQDIATSLGRTLTEAEESQAYQWISDAETLIGLRLGQDASLEPGVLALVVREAVVRRFRYSTRAGDGASSITVAVDDGNVTRRYGENEKVDTSSAGWWFLPEWWGWLAPAAAAGAFTIRPSYAPDRCWP